MLESITDVHNILKTIQQYIDPDATMTQCDAATKDSIQVSIHFQIKRRDVTYHEGN